MFDGVFVYFLHEGFDVVLGDFCGKTPSIQELGIKCERELPFARLLDFAVEPTIDAHKSVRLLQQKLCTDGPMLLLPYASRVTSGCVGSCLGHSHCTHTSTRVNIIFYLRLINFTFFKALITLSCSLPSYFKT